MNLSPQPRLMVTSSDLVSRFHHATTGVDQISGLCSVVPKDLDGLVGEKWGTRGEQTPTPKFSHWVSIGKSSFGNQDHNPTGCPRSLLSSVMWPFYGHTSFL